MEKITRWNRWANRHTNIFTDSVRVLFGAYLILKGLAYLKETDYLYQLLFIVSGKGTYYLLVHYIALAHLAGGCMIVPGLLTRFAALVNAPILVGAVTVNFIGVMNDYRLLESVAAFFLCCFFIFYGSGRHSLDKVWRLGV